MPLDHEELEFDGQKAFQRVSKTGTRGVGQARHLVRLHRMQARNRQCNTEQMSHACLLHSPRAVWKFPPPDEEGTVTIDEHSDADVAGCPQNTTLNIWRQLAHRARHVGDKVVDMEGSVAEQRRIRILQHGTPLDWPIRYVSRDTRLTSESGQMLHQHEGWPSASGGHQTRGNHLLMLAAAGRERQRTQEREVSRHDQSC